MTSIKVSSMYIVSWSDRFYEITIIQGQSSVGKWEEARENSDKVRPLQPRGRFCCHYRNFRTGSYRVHILRAPLIQPSSLIPRPHSKWMLGKRKTKQNCCLSYNMLLNHVCLPLGTRLLPWRRALHLAGNTSPGYSKQQPSQQPGPWGGQAHIRRLFVAYAA